LSPLEGLEYISFAVEASPDWQDRLHRPYHRVFGPDGATRHEVLGSGQGPVDETAELIAEHGDTLTIMVTGPLEPTALALTIHSPTVAEMTVTCGASWARTVVSLLGLPAAHHDH
jgi:hypothetical protein